MLTIKNIVKNSKGETESELELIRDFREIILECPVPEDEDVVLIRTIVLKDDGSESITEEKRIFNKALGTYEPPYIE